MRLIYSNRMNGMGVDKTIKQLNAAGVAPYERRYEFKGSRYCKVSQKQRKAGYCRVRHLHEDYQICPECVKQHGGIEITGNSWSRTLVRKVLKNRVYLGQLRVGQNWIPGAHDPIIDADTFDKVQVKIKQAYRHPYESYPRNLLSGLVHCACGRRMYLTSANPRLSKITGKLGRKYYAFTCPRRKVGKCDQKNVPVMVLEQAVFTKMDELMERWFETSDIVQKAYARILDERKQFKPDTENLKRELQKVSQDLRRLTRSYTQATIDGVKEETLREMRQTILMTEERNATLAAKVNFLESRSAAVKNGLNAMPQKLLITRLASVWVAFSRGYSPIGGTTEQSP